MAITLLCSDGIHISPDVLLNEQGYLRQLFNNPPSGALERGWFPLDISSHTLLSVIKWYQYRSYYGPRAFKDLVFEKDLLFEMVLAARFLRLNLLLEWGCNVIANVLNNGHRVSLDRLLNNLRIKIASRLKTDVFLSSLMSGALPITEHLKRRAQHRHVWTSIFTQQEIEEFHRRFRDMGNAFLIGYDLKHRYNDLFRPSERRPVSLIFAWRPLGGLGYEFDYKGDDQILGKNGEVNDLGDFVHKDNLHTNMIYLKDGSSMLYDVQLSSRGDGDKTEYFITLDNELICRNPYYPTDQFTMPHKRFSHK